MKEFYKLDVEDIYRELKSSENGLKSKEIGNRIVTYGKNKLDVKKRKSNFIKFLEQFKNLMVIILIITSIISFVVAYYEGESMVEGCIILGIVVLNAILGYVQEAKADKAIDELKKMAVPDVKVKRDNKLEIINIEEVTVGDIIVLEAGDFVPADARIIWEASLKVEEASLTGESGSVEKECSVFTEDVVINERKNMIFSGSNVVYGKCEAIVVAIGMNTELGKIAKTLSETENIDTPLQKKINNISKILSIIVGVIVLIMLVIGIVNGDDLLHVFIIAISLAVAAIPEGLPAVITVILSLGMTKLAKRKAVVRKISSVETLGSTEVICSDKTGTITKNEMTVRSLYFNGKVVDKTDSDLLNKVLLFCNDVVKQKTYIGDPTEVALYKYVEKVATIKKYSNAKRIYEFPFDSERKLMSTIYDDDGCFVYVKGSSEYLLTKCTKYYLNDKEVKLTDKHIETIKEEEINLSNKALRVLGLAYKKTTKKKEYDIKEIENDLVFIGLVGMIDPPRENVIESIQTCYQAGLKAVMITGDSLNTALAIAKEVGIFKDGDKYIEGKDLEALTDKQLEKKVNEYSVYARVTPEHKLRIVKAWQKNGKVVAMTGDGVNDAPALKMSDVGVGMGITGTEVSKNVSDIVLLDDSFSTIVVAVEEGRNIYENIRKAISYLLTANIAEIIIVFIAMLLGETIFLPIHLLYINLVTDSLPAIALSFEKNDKDIMKRSARKNTGSIFTPFLTWKIASSSVIKGISVLGVYFISLHIFGANKGTTMAFLALILLEMTYAISCKNLFKSVFNKEIFSNKYMNLSMIILIIIQLLVFMTPISSWFEIVPLSFIEIMFIFLFVIVVFALDQVLKPLFYKLFKD